MAAALPARGLNLQAFVQGEKRVRTARAATMRDSIVNRLKKMMTVQGLDAVVCISPENFGYVAGFIVPSQPLMRWRHAAAIVTADGNCAVLAVDMEDSTVRSRLNGVDVRIWGEFTDRPMSVLSDLLKDMDLSSARIGMELDYVPAGDQLELQSLLPSARFSPAGPFLSRVRQIKMPEEIRLMRRLARIADESICTALDDVSLGSSEMDIAAGLTRGVYRLGAEYFKLMIVASGERSVFPNVGPTQRQLQLGDICRVEIFPMISGYHAGVCRTARVRRSPPHADRIWKSLIECRHMVFDMIRPGASSRAIYEAFVGQLKRLELPPIQFVGHGIGLHLHEDPYLGMYSDVPLEAGMVLGIEPLVYNTGHGFGMQIKDIVLVTDGGMELLSDYWASEELLTVT
jgi:Xaa-Pro dipeptidase